VETRSHHAFPRIRPDHVKGLPRSGVYSNHPMFTKVRSIVNSHGMNLRLDPWFAQPENLAVVDVAIGGVLLLIVTFLLSVPCTREGIPHRLVRLFGPVSVYGFATWWMIQVRHATALPAIALGFLSAAIADLLVPRRSRPVRHLNAECEETRDGSGLQARGPLPPSAGERSGGSAHPPAHRGRIRTVDLIFPAPRCRS